MTGELGTKKEDAMATAYCMKCRKKVEIRNPKQVTLKNNSPAVQGVCPVCGTKVFRIGKA
jgi:DNA-directed RNA polymerase subunit RPC12/RpoP